MGMRTYNQFNKLIVVYDHNPSGKNVMGWVSLDEKDAHEQVRIYVLNFMIDTDFRNEEMKKATKIYSESFDPKE